MQMAAALAEGAAAATGVRGVATDEYAVRRLFLPARCKGGGLPAIGQAWYRAAAFLGSVHMALPALVDGGFMPFLEPSLGTNMTQPDRGLRHVLRRGGRLAAEVRAAWAACQQAYRAADANGRLAGLLATPVEELPMTGEKLQHQITEAIQDHLMAQLDREISWLPPLRRRVLNGLQLEVPDERVRAWRSVDRFSSA